MARGLERGSQGDWGRQRRRCWRSRWRASWRALCRVRCARSLTDLALVRAPQGAGADSPSAGTEGVSDGDPHCETPGVAGCASAKHGFPKL